MPESHPPLRRQPRIHRILVVIGICLVLLLSATFWIAIHFGIYHTLTVKGDHYSWDGESGQYVSLSSSFGTLIVIDLIIIGCSVWGGICWIRGTDWSGIEKVGRSVRTKFGDN